jgi:hypothetical protein
MDRQGASTLRAIGSAEPERLLSESYANVLAREAAQRAEIYETLGLDTDGYPID